MVIGCSHNKPPAGPPPPPPAPPSQCAQLADHVVGLMGASKVAEQDQLDPFRNVLTTRCTDDKWSPEAQKCLLDIKTLDEGDKCQSLLSDDQQKNLERDGTAAAKASRHKSEDKGEMGGAAPPPPPAEEPSHSRGPVPKGSGKTGDPCSGGQ